MKDAIRIKVLPLESYMDWTCEFRYDDESEVLETLGREIAPILSRDGYYLATFGGSETVWCECKGRAFDLNNGVEQFKFKLKLLVASEKLLTEKQVDAIILLRQSGLASNELSEILRSDVYAKSLRDTGRDARKYRLSVLGR